MAKVYSVSIPDNKKALLKWISEQEERKNLSASEVFQQGMEQKMLEWESENLDSPKELKRIRDIWVKKGNTMIKFLSERGLWEEYEKFESELKGGENGTETT